MTPQGYAPDAAQDPDSGQGAPWSVLLDAEPGPDLRGQDLSGTDLTRSDLKAADLRGASLRGACLADADLYCADLRDADLSAADLRGANLRHARLERTNLSGTRLEGACLKGAWLDEVDLSGANIEGADLSEIWVHGTKVTRAQLRMLGAQSVLRQLRRLAVQQDNPRRPLGEHATADHASVALMNDLRNADLSGLDLSDIDLSGRDLSGVCLAGARLSGALLIETDLSGANLDGSDLSDAVLIAAKLPQASLVGANLQGTDLGEANLWGADLTSADLRQAILCHAGLGKARLNHADLTGAVLTKAWFIAVECEGTIVEGSQLESTADPQAWVRCPICLHRGVLRDHYVWERRQGCLVAPDDDPREIWPCGHISLDAYRLYFFRPTMSGRRWLDDIGLGEIESLGQLVSDRAADLKDAQDQISAAPGRAEVESCFDRHFQVAKAKVKFSWAGPPAPVFVAPFAENPDEALRQGWTEVQRLVQDMVNPFREGTFGGSVFESVRGRLLERVSLGAAEPPVGPGHSERHRPGADISSGR
jgi:uncharacterized protein YjbI with pentapeptide repeats